MPDVVCSQNAAIAYDFFTRNMGLRDFQAAAVIGNLQVESAMNPALEAMDTNGKMSRGIAMWQPDRWDRLLSFASSTGRDPWTVYAQLDFLRYELESFPSLGRDALMNSRTLEDATVVFQNRFENPSKQYAHTDRRIAAAQSALYSCPAITPPTPAPRSKRTGVIGTVIGVAAVATAIGYGAYRWLARRPEPRPLPPPDPTYPMFRRYEP